MADVDFAVGQHVGAETAAVDECAQGAGLSRLRGQALQVSAGVAELLSEALHVADPKPLSDEGVAIDATT
jgi:hypothetical protein